MTIYEKLLAVQCELKAPKSQFNNFGKYAYRNCEDILESAKPVLAKHKALVFLTDNIELIGDRYYVKATATFVDVENPDTPPIVATAFAREEENKKGMDGSQVTGASSSYARKYALNGLFDIDDTKDSDTTNSGDNNNSKQPTQKANAKKNTKEPLTKEPLKEETKQTINAGIMRYKQASGYKTKEILNLIKKNVGFAVDEITTEEQGQKVINALTTTVYEMEKGA